MCYNITIKIRAADNPFEPQKGNFMNIIVMTGRLSTEPELRQTTNGTAVCNFSIAVPRDYKNEEGNYDSDFFNCVAWRGTGEMVAKHFKKGQRINLNGSLETRTYQDKDTGKNRTAYEIIVDRVEFGSDKKAE